MKISVFRTADPLMNWHRSENSEWILTQQRCVQVQFENYEKSKATTNAKEELENCLSGSDSSNSSFNADVL